MVTVILQEFSHRQLIHRYVQGVQCVCVGGNENSWIHTWIAQEIDIFFIAHSFLGGKGKEGNKNAYMKYKQC